MAKVKNPRDENNKNIIFTEKKSTDDGFTHYARMKKQSSNKNIKHNTKSQNSESSDK